MDDFVALMTAMSDAQEHYDGFMEQREYVQDLYVLLAEQHIAVSQEDRSAHIALSSAATRLKAALQVQCCTVIRRVCAQVQHVYY